MVEIIVALITLAGVGLTTFANVMVNKQNVKKTDLIDAINKVQLDNCKNYLVQQISAADRRDLSPAEKERYWENYDAYIALGGNSYIHSETDRLKKEGKL